METEKIAKLSKEIRIKLKEAELNNEDFLQALESVEYGFCLPTLNYVYLYHIKSSKNSVISFTFSANSVLSLGVRKRFAFP